MNNHGKKKMLNNIVANLTQLGVEFLIKDGENTYTNMTKKEVTVKKKGPRKYPFGEVTTFILNQLKEKNVDLQNGDSSFIDCKDYDIEIIRGTMSAYLTRVFGKNKFSTFIDRDKNCIWLMPTEQTKSKSDFLI